MSISKLIVTPFKYFHYIANDIFINYNHNRISFDNNGESDNNFMTHVITTKDVNVNDVITIKNDNEFIDLIVYNKLRSSTFPLTLIKLTDDQIQICRYVKYHLKYGRLRDGYNRYNLNNATYNLDLLLPSKVKIMYDYVYNGKRDIGDIDVFVDNNKIVIPTDVIFVTTEPSSRKNPIKSVNIIKKDNIPSFASSRHGSVCFDIDRRCYGIVLNGALILSIDLIDFIINAFI